MRWGVEAAIGAGRIGVIDTGMIGVRIGVVASCAAFDGGSNIEDGGCGVANNGTCVFDGAHA